MLQRVPLLEMTDEEWREVLRVNLDGTFYVTREVGRAMAARGALVTGSLDGIGFAIAQDAGLTGRKIMVAQFRFGVDGRRWRRSSSADSAEKSPRYCSWGAKENPAPLPRIALQTVP